MKRANNYEFIISSLGVHILRTVSRNYDPSLETKWQRRPPIKMETEKRIWIHLVRQLNPSIPPEKAGST